MLLISIVAMQLMIIGFYSMLKFNQLSRFRRLYLFKTKGDDIIYDLYQNEPLLSTLAYTIELVPIMVILLKCPLIKGFRGLA